MAHHYEDGLHPVVDHERFTSLPQVYRGEESHPQVYEPSHGASNAPQVYETEKSVAIPKGSDDAPEAVGEPPVYDGMSRTSNEKAGALHDERRVLGMKRKTALMAGIIALVVVVAIAVGVGAGVGITQHKNNMQTQALSGTSLNNFSTTSTTTAAPTSSTIPPTGTTTQGPSSTTPYAVQTSGFTGMAEVLCPGINNTDVGVGTSTFQVRCAVHWPNGSPAEDNNGTVQPVGLPGLAAYTLQECLQLCVDYNNNQTNVDPTQNGSGCLAVTFNANLTSAFSQYSQNCFLKDRPGVYDAAADTTESAVLISL